MIHSHRGMNTSLTAYTHLESLLLFQSLHAHGLTAHVFSTISELLKSNPHITSDTRFQSGRLSPDALRNFYLHILKEEIKSEIKSDQAAGVKNSRKRKAPSPTLPTLTDSVQHQHLIPKLVNKLYARYRTALTDQIRHDEDRYDRLQKELQGIERGEWDDQIKDGANRRPASRSPSLPRKSPPSSQQPPSSKRAPADAPCDAPPPDVNISPDRLQPQPSSVEPPPLLPQNGSTQDDRNAKTGPRKKEVPGDRRSSPSTPQPLTAPTPSQHQDRLPQPQPLAPPPRYPLQQSATAASNGVPHAHRSPYPAQAQPHVQVQNAPPSASPYFPNQAPPPHAQAGSPGPHIPSQAVQPFGSSGVHQHAPVVGAPARFSPTHQRIPRPNQSGSPSPAVQTPQQRHPSYSGQPLYPPQRHLGQPPSQGGFMLPPFQVSPQDPSRGHQQPGPSPLYPQVSTPVSTRQPSAKATPLSAMSGRPGVPPMHPLVAQARHSISTPFGVRTPQSALSSPRSAKSILKPSARKTAAVPRPEVSPIEFDDIVPPGKSQQSPSKAKASRKTRAKGKAKEKEMEKGSGNEQGKETVIPPEPDRTPEETAPETETRPSRPRRKAPVKRGRPGSIASSQAGTSVRDRSRSQSILSHTETVAADNESEAGSRIKSERGNSIDVIEEDAPAMATRRRGGNLQALPPSHKRKRNVRELSPEESEERPSSPGAPRTVVAPRHFSRMCAPLMNDISSHKHASIFTTAVRAKDAEGYYDIIKRPTDLKRIQKAIAAGAKQVAAAASGDTPAGSPGGAGGVAELPMTVENIPPKAIVNSSQLEKELMRMFVNAVMFNSGEEGVVEDARETFETVQRSVSNWRSVERSSGRLEVEETPPVMEEEVPTASKRRKI